MIQHFVDKKNEMAGRVNDAAFSAQAAREIFDIVTSHMQTKTNSKFVSTEPKKEVTPKKEETPVINNQTGGTTLGDIDALAALKAKMEKGE